MFTSSTARHRWQQLTSFSLDEYARFRRRDRFPNGRTSCTASPVPFLCAAHLACTLLHRCRRSSSYPFARRSFLLTEVNLVTATALGGRSHRATRARCLR